MKKMPPLCKEYVLAEVIIDVNSGYKDKVQKLHDEIINKNFELVVKGKVRTSNIPRNIQICFVTLFCCLFFAERRGHLRGLEINH